MVLKGQNIRRWSTKQKNKMTTKEENIFNLYDQLPKDGSKGNAIGFIAETCGVKKANVKANWFLFREFPSYIQDNKLDEIIDYLQKAVNLKNQTA